MYVLWETITEEDIHFIFAICAYRIKICNFKRRWVHSICCNGKFDVQERGSRNRCRRRRWG